MLGAILGDIAGSRYEFINNRKRPTRLWVPEDFFTDDTVLSMATAATMLYKDEPKQTLQKHYVYFIKMFVEAYPRESYGARFISWIASFPTTQGVDFDEWKSSVRTLNFNNSAGNGCAMKISPVVYACDTLEDAKYYAKLLTEVTHNDPESFRAVEALVTSMWMALDNKSKEEIRDNMVKYYPEIEGMTYEQLRRDYEYSEYVLETVPQAFVCFLDSTSFESAILNAVSIGGDADTLAAITGSVAEAYYKYSPARPKESIARVFFKTVRMLEEFMEEELVFKVLDLFLSKYNVMKRLQK